MYLFIYLKTSLLLNVIFCFLLSATKGWTSIKEKLRVLTVTNN